MALTDENGGTGMVMPVTPMGYGYGGYPMGGFGGGFGNMFGADSGWLVLLLILAMGGGMGWGGFGGFGGWGGMMGLGMADGFGAFPWILASNANNQNSTNASFDALQMSNQISGLRSDVNSGFRDNALGIAGVNQNICQSTGQIQNTLCQGFAGTTAAVTGAQNAIAQQLYNNEIASLNRSFAEQTANAQGFNAAQRQLSDCCCENRLATQALNSTIISENCADREALSNGIRDIITAQTAGTQRILDVLCQNKIDEQAQTISELRTQVQMQNLAASQAAQTAALVADNTAQTQYIVNRVAPYPIPAFQVGNPYGYYGYNNGNCCGNNIPGFAG